MGFGTDEKEQMLALKWVGETVIGRLEQIGFSSLDELSSEDPEVITLQISHMMGSTCWHNSPQAKTAIRGIIDLAKGTERG